jgi:guanosine-3',5'-bis(diphosphate) 3'-pyrophosphohydrolase
MTIEALVGKVRAYDSQADLNLVRRAYGFAAQAHDGQKRLSGEPYISHPLAVATILTDIQADQSSIAAGLLHDTIEDCGVTQAQIADAFGLEIARLVEGVTKLTRIDFRTEQDEQAENFRKMLLAMAEDLRVIIIKLADRLHNMQTLGVFPQDRQRAIASETLQIFTPIAHRLGIWHLKWQLEDLCLRHLEPAAYEDIASRVAQSRQARERDVEQAVEQLQRAFREKGIDATVHGRPKHFYSIYEKMRREGLDLDQILDLTALRVLVHSISDCYAALGIVHDLWLPLPGMFADHIAKPKPNRYQSLHTKVLSADGRTMEVQIRTWDMHRTAEYGVAAHWRYKEGGGTTEFDKKMAWLRQLVELETDLKDSHEFLESVKMDLFRDEVFVFTPQGDVIDLPAGSGPLDFAYRIHTMVGHRCVGAKVNGRMVSLDYQFRNGDICEIVMGSKPRPSMDWLKIVKTSHARAKVRQFLRKEQREENVHRGRELLEREIRRLSQEEQKLINLDRLREVAASRNYATEEDLLAALGYGGVDADGIVQRLREQPPAPETITQEAQLLLAGVEGRRRAPARIGVSLGGVTNLKFTLAKCCSPVPGDHIVGYITRTRGLAIHRADCKNLQVHRRRAPERVRELQWTSEAAATYPVEIHIRAFDRPGLLADITAIITERKLNIARVDAHPQDSHSASIRLELQVHSAQELVEIINRIRRLGDVWDVHRGTGARLAAPRP